MSTFTSKKEALLALSENFQKADTANAQNFDAVTSNFQKYPHLFVLACLMDRGIPAERAWTIPVDFCDNFCGKDYSFGKLKSLQSDFIRKNFNNLHRYENKMAEVFIQAIQKIGDKYNGDASLIWKGCPESALVVSRFLDFYGCGIKIATMATNILHRDLGIPLADTCAIDISPDVHVCRIFSRMDLVSSPNKKDAVVYMARAICPEYPGKIDYMCWRIGQEYCRPSKNATNCSLCPLSNVCPKKFENDNNK